MSEVETWVELSRFNGRDMDAACFALSPDGKTLATGGGKTIHLWDLETGAHLLQFRDEKSDTAARPLRPGRQDAGLGRARRRRPDMGP